MQTRPQHSQLHRNRRRHRRRGGLLLEFVMLLPILLVLFLLLFDGARVLLVSGAVSDATYRSARAGAVSGGAQFGNSSQNAFDQALDEIPGANQAQEPTMRVVRGNVCSNVNPYVEVEASYQVDLITPGLANAFGLLGNSDVSDGRLEFTSNAVARCEVAQ